MTNAWMSKGTAGRNLMAALEDAGIFPDRDLAEEETVTTTPIVRLLKAIREWADDQVAARCKQGPEGCRKPPR